MHRTIKAVLIATSLAALAAAPACSRTTYSNRAANRADTLIASDWSMFADHVVASIDSNRLASRYSRDGRPPVIVIGDFKNRTSNASFTRQKDFMYNEVQAALVNSGMFTVNMDIAGAGGDIEPLIREIRQLRDSDEYDQRTTQPRGRLRAPDLILYGEINRIIARAGRSTQYDYQVNTRMIDAETGEAVWFGTIPLSKSFTRGLLG